MEVQTQIIQAVSEFFNISIGQLTEGDCTVMELAPSSTPRRFFSGESYEQISLLILSKSKSQKTTLESLNAICNKCRTLNLPYGEKWQIKHIEISTSPGYVGQEKYKDGIMWIYSCILTVHFYNMEGF